MVKTNEPGYVYILTNPSFREDWVKIGKSARPVDIRSKERPESHAVAERGEIRQIAPDDAVRIVGRTGERERDGNGFFVETVDNLAESVDHRRETFVQIVSIRGYGDRLDDELIGAHGAEDEVGASGVQRDDCAVIVGIHGFRGYWFSS